MYAKVTNGAVIKYYDLNDPKSRSIYNELIQNDTGFNVVVEEGSNEPKPFTEEQVKGTIEEALAASHVAKRKNPVSSNRAVKDED